MARRNAVGAVRAGLVKGTDLVLAAAVVGILALMIVPFPAILLDFLLSFNITFSLLVLLVSMYILKPLEFSVFPSLLLVVTLFRLALNVASTRLILLRGNEGEGAAGEVIRAFGQFVVGGNYVVGVVVFLIIVVIQFVVVTKGAGRIAEVAARFTLDAMPGKQMSIDADLNAGLITEQDARRRRETIAREADFYGAMDGASKFVRGDAVAGLIITAINILGGFAIGVFQQGLDIADALSTYTILTIGDGLVTQIPALIVSIAAGIVVTRAAAESDLSRDLVGQLTVHPRALALAAGVLTILAIVPGMPTVPFLVLAAVTGGGARLIRGSRIAAAKKKEGAAPPPSGPEKVETLLALDPLELEVGYSLVPLVDPAKGGDLLERVRMLRRQFALDMGFVVPPVRIRDNLQLASTHYAIKLRGFEVAQGEVYADRFLAMNPGTAQEGLEGIETREPTFGLPALWITSRQKERAQAAGYTVVDPSTVIATHLSEAIRSHARDLLSRQDTQVLVDQVKGSQPAVVEGLIPNLLPLGTVQKVLQNLLSESVSIRDLPQILEVLADYAPHTKDPAALTEYVRATLAKTVCRPYLSQDQTLRVLVLSPQSESALTELLEGEGGNVDLRVAQQIIEAVATAIAEAPLDGRPVLLVSPSVRPHLRRLTERPLPHLAVLSYNEVPSQVTVQSIGTVEFANVYQAV